MPYFTSSPAPSIQRPSHTQRVASSRPRRGVSAISRGGPRAAGRNRWPSTSVEWLTRLVAHLTVAGQSNLDLIEDVRTFLSEMDVQSLVIPGTRGGTANLYATLGPDTDSGVVLSAHTDVVDADPSEWSSDPFSVTQRDGRLYGRGATDMKGFIATVLATVPTMKATALRRPISIALSADEELGVRGVRPMLDVLASRPERPAFCVVGEPTRMRAAVAHKGKVAFRIHFRSQAAHSSVAPRAISAIEHAAKTVTDLYAYQATLASDARDERFPIAYATVNVGRIDGGVSVNVVAPTCSLDGEIRALPEQDLERLLLPIRECVRDIAARMGGEAANATATLEILSSYPGLDARGEVPEFVAELAETDFGMAVDFGTEAGLFQQCLDIPVVVCGPGDIAQAHARDEYIEEDQLLHAERFVHRITNWCAQ